MKKRISKAGITDAVGVVGGAVAAQFLSAKLPIANQTIKNAAPLAVGLVLSMGKNKNLKNVGLGMIAAGGAKLVGGFISGGGVGRYIYAGGPSGETVAGFRTNQPGGGGPI